MIGRRIWVCRRNDWKHWSDSAYQLHLEFMTLELKQLLPSIVQQIENAREQRRTD